MALENSVETPYLFDVIAILDYGRWIGGCVDPKFGSYATGDNTMHRFRFTKTDVDVDKYPLGVKVMYRKYSADEAVEIRNAKDQEDQVNFETRVYRSKWGPTEITTGDDKRPEGIHLLLEYPKGKYHRTVIKNNMSDPQ